MKNKTYITFIIILLYSLSIIGQQKMSYNAINAKVLQHYKKTKETQKYKAAKFLLDNMQGHSSPTGPIIETYIKELHKRQNLQIDSINYCWEFACQACIEDASFKDDKVNVDANALIENIDDAFSRWTSVPWRNEIPFDHFCKYILPYRCIDEAIAPHWRKIFIDKYAPLINNCTDMKEAYSIICNKIRSTIKITYPKCPYPIDPINIDFIKNGNCEQCSVLTLSILRAIGIPAAIDMTPIWANYSRSGHFWACLVLKNGDTYTLKSKDSIARKNNPIDASEFYDYKIAKDDPYPNDILLKKKTSKIFRYIYQKNNTHSFLSDVSNVYGLNNNITLNTSDKENTKYYLCTFCTGDNWTCVDSTLATNKKIIFNNVGSNIVYLICEDKNEKIKPISTPFLLHDNGDMKFFNPQSQQEEITIYRKYPIISPIVIQWDKMKGSVIEASNDSDFARKDTIGILHNLLYGDYKIKTKPGTKYRYVRYNTKTAGTEIVEFGVFSNNNGIEKEIMGSPIFKNVDPKSVKYAFDKNPLTKIRTLHHYYWFGEDLGKAHSISSIKLIPKSDGNDIEIGDIYELFYFDNKWISLGRRKADTYCLTYNAPRNSILLLKNLSNGSEERIFIYKYGKLYFY